MFGNGIQETTTTTGTGAITTSAMTGYPRFSDVFAVGDLVSYAIQSGNNWEWGIGTYSAANTITRSVLNAKYDTGVYSLNPATGITLAGTSTVMCTDNAAYMFPAVGGPAISDATLGAAILPDGFTEGGNGTCSVTIIALGLVRVGRQFTATKLGAYVYTADATPGYFRMGLYSVNPITKDMALLNDSGDISAATTGFKVASISTVLRPGLYALAFGTKTASAQFRFSTQNKNDTSLYGVVSVYGTMIRTIQAAISSGWTALPSTITGDSLVSNQYYPVLMTLGA